MLPLPRTSTARRRLLAGSLGALALALAGCGGTSATYHAPLLALKLSEFTISPESVEMQAGQIRLRVTNDGVLVHEVAVANADGHILGQTGAVFPGHTATSVAFDVGPGSYRLYDPGANYADLGMYGSLRVMAR